MIRFRAAHLLCALPLAASGCASAPDAGYFDKGAALRVYEYNETRALKYRIVERIWMDTLQASTYLPGHPTERQAIAALKARAAQNGADAVLNLACLDQKTFWQREPAFICYGDAIKIE